MCTTKFQSLFNPGGKLTMHAYDLARNVLIGQRSKLDWNGLRERIKTIHTIVNNVLIIEHK